MDADAQEVMTAINKYYNDTRRPAAITVENLEEISEELAVMIEALKVCDKDDGGL